MRGMLLLTIYRFAYHAEYISNFRVTVHDYTWRRIQSYSQYAYSRSRIQGDLQVSKLVVHAGAGRFSCICRIYGQ